MQHLKAWRGIFFDDKEIILPDECVGAGGCWRNYGEPGIARGWDAVQLHWIWSKLVEVNNPVFLDIGANTGNVALLASLIPTSKCIAFEPYEQTYNALKKAIELNVLGNQITLEKLALSNKCGHETLLVPVGTETGMATIGSNNGTPTTAHIVDSMTLDAYLESHPIERLDLICMDVEGAEPLVIEG
jgi:FkbM family methyltransferase